MYFKAGINCVKIAAIKVLIIFVILNGCQMRGIKNGKSAVEKGDSVRNTAVLADRWKFQIDIRNIGETEGWFTENFDRSGWGKVTVPQAWDCYETALWGYEGIGWYAVTINPEDFTAGKRTEVLFNRVMYYSKVWLNGEYVGENIGGYLPFRFDITGYLKPGQENRLVMRVDNKPRIEWLPAGKQIEWVQYGGILEPVELVSTSHTYIDDFTIRTMTENGGARINCIVNIANNTDTESEIELEVKIARDTGIVSEKMKVECKPNESSVANIELTIDHAELWSPETPVLYIAAVYLKKKGVIIDNLSERFGIRTVSIDGTSILLNGKHVTIKGVNRYDEYGRLGPNVPEEILRNELSLMKSAGINTIRVHYPQSPNLLSLYDEYGFMMMEEVPLNWWGRIVWGPVDQNLDILKQAKPALKKMIARDKNHPCVIIWSVANECETDNETGITVMRELMRLAKSLDPTRPVTFTVSHDPTGHLAFDEADIVCVNKYSGITSRGKICHHIAQIDSFGNKVFAEELTLHREYIKNKPMIITEFGCQGIKNVHGDVYFSEEFQAAYIEKIWSAIRSVDGVSGGILWSWADYYHRKHFTNYAVFGPYGVVTVDRQPKKSLEALARMYGGSVVRE